MRTFSIAALLGVILLIACLLRYREGARAVPAFERFVVTQCEQKRWSEVYISKYFSCPANSKLAPYAAVYSYPGRLDRGLGQACFTAALAVANEKYHLNLDGININQLPDDRWINIYFFDTAAMPSLKRFKGQCVYLGLRNIILCDAQFLRQFQEMSFIEAKLDTFLRSGLDSCTLFDQPHSSYEPNFLLWNLAAAHHAMLWALLHEIGHLANHHSPPTATEQFLRPTRSNLRIREMENEADEFAVEALRACRGPGLAFVIGGLENVITGIIAAKLHVPDGVLPYPLGDLDQQIPVRRTTGTHPPMLIRLLDAVVVFERRFPDFSRLQTATFAKLRSQIILVP